MDEEVVEQVFEGVAFTIIPSDELDVGRSDAV
jgi:hypothetical protein